MSDINVEGDLEQVLQNVINSELGGSVEDYVIVDAPPLEDGKKYIINDDGTVGQEVPAINSRLEELKAKIVDDTATLRELREYTRLTL